MNETDSFVREAEQKMRTTKTGERRTVERKKAKVLHLLHPAPHSPVLFPWEQENTSIGVLHLKTLNHQDMTKK